MNKTEFLERLSSCWSKYPNLRFGQFMNNAFAVLQMDGKDPFLMSDEEMIQFLEKYVNGENLIAK